VYRWRIPLIIAPRLQLRTRRSWLPRFAIYNRSTPGANTAKSARASKVTVGTNATGALHE
jgi:hypothetical protein